MATLLDLTNRVKGEMGLSSGEYTIHIQGGEIASVADYDSTVEDTVLMTDVAHGLETGDYIHITDCEDYNSTFTGKVVTKVSDDTFYITEDFTETRTGNWVRVIADDKIIINDVEFRFNSSASLTAERINIALDNNGSARGRVYVAESLRDWINGVFSQSITGSSVLATASSNVVTITGASRVFNIASGHRVEQASGTPIQQLNKGCVINTVSSEDEPPSTSDIFQYIKDAQYDLLNKLHENALIKDSSSAVSTGGDLVKTIEFTNTSYINLNRVDIGSITHYNGSSNVAVDILKIIDLSYKSNTISTNTFTEVDSKTRAEKVPFDLLQDIRGGNHPFYKVEDYSDVTPIPKFYTVMGNILELSHKLSSTAAVQNLSLVALVKPSEVFTTECSFGEHLQDLVVMYAKAKCYELVNRFDIAQNIMNNYNQTIGIINLKHSVKDVDKFEMERPKA